MRRQTSRALQKAKIVPRSGFLQILFRKVALAYHNSGGNKQDRIRHRVASQALMSCGRVVDFRPSHCVCSRLFHIFWLLFEARSKASVIDHEVLLPLIHHLIDFAEEWHY